MPAPNANIHPPPPPDLVIANPKCWRSKLPGKADLVGIEMRREDDDIVRMRWKDGITTYEADVTLEYLISLEKRDDDPDDDDYDPAVAAEACNRIDRRPLAIHREVRGFANPWVPIPPHIEQILHGGRRRRRRSTRRRRRSNRRRRV